MKSKLERKTALFVKPGQESGKSKSTRLLGMVAAHLMKRNGLMGIVSYFGFVGVLYLGEVEMNLLLLFFLWVYLRFLDEGLGL